MIPCFDWEFKVLNKGQIVWPSISTEDFCVWYRQRNHETTPFTIHVSHILRCFPKLSQKISGFSWHLWYIFTSPPGKIQRQPFFYTNSLNWSKWLDGTYQKEKPLDMSTGIWLKNPKQAPAIYGNLMKNYGKFSMSTGLKPPDFGLPSTSRHVHTGSRRRLGEIFQILISWIFGARILRHQIEGYPDVLKRDGCCWQGGWGIAMGLWNPWDWGDFTTIWLHLIFQW